MVELRPRRTRATAAAESAPVEETPKAKPKTPKASKRKAIEDVSPSATKKQKSVKTPVKPKDTEESVTEKVEESTPKIKKGKTPIKAKATEEEIPNEIVNTPVSKPKKAKTPAKPKAAEEAALPEVVEKTPASKSQKEKTPAKPKAVIETPSKPAEQPTPKAKKEKTPAKPKEAPKATPAKVKEAPKATPIKPKEAPKATPAKAKETPKAAAPETPAPKSNEKTPKKTPKSVKKSAKKAEPEPEPEVEKEAVEEAVEEAPASQDEQVFSDEEVDEQTLALAQTIDAGNDDEPELGVVLFEQGQDVGKIPEVSKKEKKQAKKALAALKEKEDSGVIYIGRLPHGFYEHEMKSYFTQFGPIRNLRVSRNKKTGKAKHYAFVEFEELSTAEIVAKTMDNYLLFGHILKCSVIPKAQVPTELFKGANKRFKPVPWNKMEGKVMERPMLEDKWKRKIAKENKRRADRAKKLEALGYEFNAPELMSIDAAKAITKPETAQEEPIKAIEQASTKAIEAPPVVDTPAPAPAADAEQADQADQAEKEQETTPKPAKRARGRPAKTPVKAAKATETPRKTRRTKA